MSRQIQIRKGTSVEHENFTGVIGEVTMDTTNKTLRVHDGETVGGTVLAKKSEILDLSNLSAVQKDCIMELLMPDTSSRKQVTLPYTMPYNGYCFATFIQNNSNLFLYIDDVLVFSEQSGSEYINRSTYVMVKKGSVIKGSGVSNVYIDKCFGA